MEAFILAAGLGTRLRPLTNDRPKAMVEVGGKPLIEIAINNLISQGVSRIVVNVHHYGNQIVSFIESRHWEVPIFISDETDLLLDTGGGLKKAEHLFGGSEPILIHNVDIISRLDLKEFAKQHTDSRSIATLATSERLTSRYLLSDANNQLIGWHNTKTDEYKWASTSDRPYKHLAFSGIAIIQPELLQLMPPADSPYPIIPTYLEIAKNHAIKCLEHNPADWLDVGKPETLAKAAELLNR